jgi:hypothetical protein
MGAADPLVMNGEPFCRSRLTVRQLLGLRAGG